MVEAFKDYDCVKDASERYSTLEFRTLHILLSGKALSFSLNLPYVQYGMLAYQPFRAKMKKKIQPDKPKTIPLGCGRELNERV